MKLSDKIVGLRKSKGMSQERMAEKLNVSRQAVSRWEKGTALPDSANILQLSKLFGVTADYLLNDDFRDNDLPAIKEIREDNRKMILLPLILLELMILWIQFMAAIILENIFFGVLSIILFMVIICGFEYGYRKKRSEANETTALFRRRFYQISAWLGLYFPIRFLVSVLLSFYPHPYPIPVFEGTVLGVYIGISILVTLLLKP